eukprot:1078908-Rhodomonas_salina.1
MIRATLPSAAICYHGPIRYRSRACYYQVTWDDGFWPSWYWGACSAAIVGAWLVAVLLTCVLIRSVPGPEFA